MDRRPRVLPAELNFLAPLAIAGMTRVGNVNDGGYVIPRSSILEADTLVSLGLSTDWSFDEHFKRLNPGIVIHVYDHTVSQQLFQQSFRKGMLLFALGRISRRDLMDRLRRFRAYRAFFSHEAKHFVERIHSRIDSSQDATFDKVFGRTSSSRIFLKIDIEGSEYRIIDGILRYADRIVGMVVEFHDTEPLRQVFCTAVKRLQQRFDIVHLHANNFGGVGEDDLPEVLELTFARPQDARTLEHRSLLPVRGLDNPNNPARSDYEIRFSL